MSPLKRSSFLAIGYLFCAPFVGADEGEWTALTVGPNEIINIDPSTWAVTNRTSLPAVPAAISFSKDDNYLYLLVNGGTNIDGSLADAPSQLLVFDRPEHRVVATFDAGWGASRIAHTTDGRFIACYRDQSPELIFERPPSLAVGTIRAIKTARASHRPSKVTLIDASNHKLLWQIEVDEGDRNILFSPSTGNFYWFTQGAVNVVDASGSKRSIALIQNAEKWNLALSPDGLWLYALQEGRDGSSSVDQVKSRIWIIDTVQGKVVNRIEAEREGLTVTEGTDQGGIGVFNWGGRLRNFVGQDLKWTLDASGELYFARRLETPKGLLVVAKKKTYFLQNDGSAPAWSVQADFNGTPDSNMIFALTGSSAVFPILTTNQGLSLDRVALLDLQNHSFTGSIPIGRRGRMAAKNFGLTAANAIGGSSFGGFSWNRLALDLTGSAGKAFALMVPPNPFLAVSRDGQSVYALSFFGNDLTIVRASDGNIVEKLPTGGNTRGLIRSESGNLAIWTDKELIWLNTSTNKIMSKGPGCGSHIDRAQISPDRQQVISFGPQCMTIWNAVTGEAQANVQGIGDPKIVFGGPADRPKP